MPQCDEFYKNLQKKEKLFTAMESKFSKDLS